MCKDDAEILADERKQKAIDDAADAAADAAAEAAGRA